MNLTSLMTTELQTVYLGQNSIGTRSAHIGRGLPSRVTTLYFETVATPLPSRKKSTARHQATTTPTHRHILQTSSSSVRCRHTAEFWRLCRRRISVLRDTSTWRPYWTGSRLECAERRNCCSNTCPNRTATASHKTPL